MAEYFIHKNLADRRKLQLERDQFCLIRNSFIFLLPGGEKAGPKRSLGG